MADPLGAVQDRSFARASAATVRAYPPERSYPGPEQEAEIICHESGVDGNTACSLAFVGGQLRRLGEAGVIEGPGTRLLVHVGSLLAGGISPRRASDVALVQALSDDTDVQTAIRRGGQQRQPERSGE